jgi:uncharacterized heparinase superfamily protein
MHNPEYHLLGNHLLENGFSLLFGACYFKDIYFYNKARQIIKSELNEQILRDGAHFELSPMYHQIILHRVLDCINLTQQNKWSEEEELSALLKSKASEMLSWLHAISYQDGTVPRVNDSTENIAARPEAVFSYARNLGVQWLQKPLSESGYRKIERNGYELFLDVGRVGPTYQSGHAHADTFSFELRFDGQPLLVDPGISTYENNSVRARERSTSYHNTVTVNNKNSSEVWGGFRMADRADVKLLIDEDWIVSASHNGFSKLGIEHKRTFNGERNILTIEDEVSGGLGLQEACFHFHPNCLVEVNDDLQKVVVNETEIKFTGCKAIRLSDYDYAIGFNKTVMAKKVIIEFDQKLWAAIKFNT